MDENNPAMNGTAADTPREQWRALLDGFSIPTPIPSDGFPLPPTPPDTAGPRASWVHVRRDLSDGVGAKWVRAAESRQLPFAAFLEAAWALVLGRANAEDDVVFGVAADPSIATAAFAMTVVPFRARIERDRPFGDWAEALARGFAPLRAHPLPSDEYHALTGIDVRLPLYESIIGPPASSSDSPVPEGARAPLFLRLVTGLGMDTATAPLGPSTDDRQSAPTCIEAFADPARLDQTMLERLLIQLDFALTTLAFSPEVALKDISLLAPSERALVVDQWNARANEQASEHCVHELFEEQVSRSPEAVAILYGDRRVTYAELDARADALAAHLERLGVRPGDCVALCLERTPELIVALLAILKAGGAYVPIEPTYPKNRIELMLQDSAPTAIVTETALDDLLPATAVPRIVLDRLSIEPAGRRARNITPAHRAYVIYTSGSTGTPKGVEVPHRAIERLVRNVEYAHLGPDVTILHAAPVAFDASTFEIWGALLNGGRVALYPDPIPTARGLAAAIVRHRVTTMWLTAALFNAVVDEDPSALAPLEQLLIGGEALSVHHVRKAYEVLGSTQIINGYGPTETTTFATCHAIPREIPRDAKSIPIGRAIRQTRLYVLDAERRPVPVGSFGELYIGGKGVALGYLNRPELTRERFLDDPFVPGERVYRTGDWVRFRRDGVVDYVGRADQQVKIRGFRIELGEIETAIMALPGIKSCVVEARKRTSGEKRLVAYLVADNANGAPTTTDLRQRLAARLPDYMVPSAFVWLASLPVTLNGKVDRRALPDPAAERPELSVEYVAPSSPLEQLLTGVWAEALDLKQVGVLDNLFDLGASSLLVVKVVAKLEREHGIAIPVIRVFQHPTIGELARLLEPNHQDTLADRLRGLKRARQPSDRGFAIVGMAGRFPGAANVDELWANLCAGRDTISTFRVDELDPSLTKGLVSDPSYVRARGVLEGVELFDAPFFAMAPKEAALTDPQQRVLLEVAWETLENAGCVPGKYKGTIGVFAGKYNDSYFAENVVKRPDLIAELGAFQTMLANEKDYVATRIAHSLNLTGPALSIHTACSTSLVAVVQAIQSLESGQCDAALAGGVSITIPVKSGYLYQEGAMLSPDGHTRTFDANAKGTVFSDGAAMVLIKRLSDAIADGDTIYAVIRGGAVNNDGANKASFTAPSADGQALVIAMAHEDAGVDPRALSYIEAHGTATPLGDPIEIEGLTKAFRLKTQDRQFCAIGSVKSNLGHLVIAAGATGLIKTALALTHEVIPPSIHYESPNPQIDFANSPFRVVSRLTPWPVSETPRLAGVSSFGVGGTNAHVVVSEAPPAPAPAASARAFQLLLLSARSESALEAACRRLSAHLKSHPNIDLADAAFTLHEGRAEFPWRCAVVAAKAERAAQLLEGRAPEGQDAKRVASRKATGRAPEVAFMFPGQGAQHPNMARSLYREQPVFRAHVDRCAEILRTTLGRDLRELVFGQVGDPAAPELLRQTEITQPALFVIEYALAMLWSSWGVRPATMIGHSVGEFVCATLAGVFALEDAIGLVAARGRMMQEQPGGSMLSVRLPAADVEARLTPDLTIASDNGPSLCVVAGPTDSVRALEAILAKEGVACRLLQTSHAFHSAMMEPVVEPFCDLVKKVALRPPSIPFVSTATGEEITAAQATDPRYWARHLRVRVRFAEGVRTLLRRPRVLLEVGPRTTLATLARQQITDRAAHPCISSLGDSDESTWTSLLSAAGQLWTLGRELDAGALHGPERRRHVPLPTYPFERKRHWVDVERGQRAEAAGGVVHDITAAPAPAAALRPAESGAPSGVSVALAAGTSPEPGALADAPGATAALAAAAALAARPPARGSVDRTFAVQAGEIESPGSPDPVESVIALQLELMSAQLDLLAALPDDEETGAPV